MPGRRDDGEARLAPRSRVRLQNRQPAGGHRPGERARRPRLVGWSVIALQAADQAERHPRQTVADPDPQPSEQRLLLPLPRRELTRAGVNRLLEAAAELRREPGIVDEHVRLAGEEQAERIDV